MKKCTKIGDKKAPDWTESQTLKFGIGIRLEKDIFLVSKKQKLMLIA